MGLAGRVAWITGASRGLGRTLACAFAGAGAAVLLSARSSEPLEELAAAIKGEGGDAEIVVGSVADPAVIAASIAAIEARWGRLDTLVNNAGISPFYKRSEQIGAAEMREVIEINLLAPLACCQAALPLLEADGGGSVVNVSSIHGSVAAPRMVGYAASKGGLETVTRTLAVEWAARGVRLNSLAPGYLHTDLSAGLVEHPHLGDELRSRTPLGRFAGNAEIAACALFLAGPASSYVTGTTLFADGGWTAQ
ncbi:MAG: SDR family oxidoreductase [Actinobacteria bacterium]|nr:SDR family oxidoreductase [Actinomycetota bacterium]